jgi:uncharacterized protein (TIGR03067 family)
MKLLKLFAAAAFGLAAVAAGADDTKKGGGKDAAGGLEGGYTIVSGERGGKPIPAEEIKGSIVRFTKDEVIGTDKDKKQIFVAKYTLDSSKTPWVIRMKSTAPAEGEATGLIEKKDDTVRIIYNLPGGKVPDDFKAEERQQLFVLKNMNKGGKDR